VVDRLPVQTLHTAGGLKLDMETAKLAGRDGIIEPVSAAELGVRIENEMVGWDGIEPPTPGFSVLDYGLRKCA
jgi:hypothetical protein